MTATEIVAQQKEFSDHWTKAVDDLQHYAERAIEEKVEHFHDMKTLASLIEELEHQNPEYTNNTRKFAAAILQVYPKMETLPVSVLALVIPLLFRIAHELESSVAEAFPKEWK